MGSPTSNGRTALVKKLLRNAKNGRSQYSLEEMRHVIRDIFERSHDMPQEHKEILAIGPSDLMLPRALTAYNLCAQIDGRDDRLYETKPTLPSARHS